MWIKAFPKEYKRVTILSLDWSLLTKRGFRPVKALQRYAKFLYLQGFAQFFFIIACLLA